MSAGFVPGAELPMLEFATSGRGRQHNNF